MPDVGQLENENRVSVELHFNDQLGRAAPGISLFDAAESVGIKVPTSCRKQGKCKECMVEVAEGMELLSARVPEESHLKGDFRLSCCCRVMANSGTVRCHTMRRGDMQIERQAHGLPGVDRHGALDPAVTRSGGRILLDGVEIGSGSGPLHGLAMDLGTTTVVLRLLNLETGERIADACFENPQRFAGSDVMARIQYDSEDRTRLLQRTLAGYLSHAIEDFPVDPKSIYEMTVAGNSTMRDLFFGLNVHSIGQSPYQSLTELDLAAGRRASTALTDAARRLSLPLNPRARVYGLPIISGHVGADAAACLLAVNMAEEERLVAVMDIGTNTELIVGNRHKILAASCPAGPAFEGGKITCGMPGLSGAIDRVQIGPDGSMRVHVIGDVEPEGICGSGLVDLLAELLKSGRMNALGRFEGGESRVTVSAGPGQPIVFCESDINELAQAKGAHVAGLQIVLGEYGIRFDQLEVFYLAGGFGRHLNVDSARRIGLIPNIDSGRIVQLGNGSIEGASMALLSRTRRDELERLVRTVTHCRLETHPGFFDYFVEGCHFQPFESCAAREAS